MPFPRVYNIRAPMEILLSKISIFPNQRLNLLYHCRSLERKLALNEPSNRVVDLPLRCRAIIFVNDLFNMLPLYNAVVILTRGLEHGSHDDDKAYDVCHEATDYVGSGMAGVSQHSWDTKT